MRRALQNLTEIEAEAVWDAIAAYVENGRDAIDYAGQTPGAVELAKLEAAERVQDRLDAAKAGA